MPRYPDADSFYYILSARFTHFVWHDDFGLLESFDCLGAAEGYISDREDEDETAAEAEREALAEAEGVDLSVMEAA